MADSKITYKGDKGFWIEEEFMQLAYYYIYDELKKSQYNIANKDDLLYSIKFHIDGYSSGIMSLGWGAFSPLDEQTMLQALQNVKTILLSKGIHISVLELQSIPSEDEDFKHLYSRNPFPTTELIKIIDALIQMLQGTWTSDNYDMDINYRY